ncbi:MAG TPA: tryptophan 7-halogenase [Gemmatimonadales bacterium]|nr:tryptophan 7-halogenase [Gemmatimonadales bacterium]
MDADVVVLGGGPAGAAAAGMLARLGARVLVLTRAARWSIGESIPPSTARLFDELELSSAVDRGGFLRSRGNTVWWGDAPVRIEPFPPEATGWQVERARFDEVLLGAAEGAGAKVERETVVHTVETGPDRQTVNGQITARWVLDCTGRAGVLARRAGREARAGRATFALHGVWESSRWEVPDPTHTLIETTRGGWAWSIPVTERRRHVTVMVDPPSGTLEGTTLAEIYRTELGSAKHFSRLIRDAELAGSPGGLSASPYVASRFAGPGWALVGDAASFIDPLSSFGIKKALAAAWLAAVMVHTSLTEESMTAAAIALFERRERDAFEELTRQAESMWTGESAPAHDETALLRDDPSVHAAFDALKQADAIAFRAATDVTVVAAPTVRGQRVVLEPHLTCAWRPDGVRFIRGISVPALTSLASGATQVPDLFDRYVRAEGPADLRDFLGVLSLLVAKRVLVPA